MRVVYVSTLAGGGPVSHLLDLAPEVARRGVHVRAVCATEEIAGRLRADGVEAVVIPLGGRLDLAGALRAQPLLRGADVVHTQDRRAGLLARVPARLRGTRCVHTLHGLPERLVGLVGRPDAPIPPGVDRLRVAAEAALARLGWTVTPTRAMADFLLAHGFPRDRVVVVPNATEARPFEPRRANGTTVVATAANLEAWKGVDVLVDACSRVRAPLRLEVYGDGSRRGELERQAAAKGVAAGFHGHVGDVPERLRAADVFVLPSRGENLPMAILEAMGSGLPVVASRVGGIHEAVLDGETGYLVPPDDPVALAERLERLAADAALRESMGRAAVERVGSAFSTEVIGAAVVDLYERVCGSST